MNKCEGTKRGEENGTRTKSGTAEYMITSVHRRGGELKREREGRESEKKGNRRQTDKQTQGKTHELTYIHTQTPIYTHIFIHTYIYANIKKIKDRPQKRRAAARKTDINKKKFCKVSER